MMTSQVPENDPLGFIVKETLEVTPARLKQKRNDSFQLIGVVGNTWCVRANTRNFQGDLDGRFASRVRIMDERRSLGIVQPDCMPVDVYIRRWHRCIAVRLEPFEGPFQVPNREFMWRNKRYT